MGQAAAREARRILGPVGGRAPAERRQELSEKAIAGNATFFGVIGRGLDKGEREAIIEYVKSL